MIYKCIKFTYPYRKFSTSYVSTNSPNISLNGYCIVCAKYGNHKNLFTILLIYRPAILFKVTFGQSSCVVISVIIPLSVFLFRSPELETANSCFPEKRNSIIRYIWLGCRFICRIVYNWYT